MPPEKHNKSVLLDGYSHRLVLKRTPQDYLKTTSKADFIVRKRQTVENLFNNKNAFGFQVANQKITVFLNKHFCFEFIH